PPSFTTRDSMKTLVISVTKPLLSEPAPDRRGSVSRAASTCRFNYRMASFRREHSDRLNFDQRTFTGQLLNFQRSAGGRRSRIHILVADFADDRELDTDVRQISIELDDILHMTASAFNGRLQILEH